MNAEPAKGFRGKRECHDQIYVLESLHMAVVGENRTIEGDE